MLCLAQARNACIKAEQWRDTTMTSMTLHRFDISIKDDHGHLTFSHTRLQTDPSTRHISTITSKHHTSHKHKMSDNTQQPSLIGGHAQYVKGAAEVHPSPHLSLSPHPQSLSLTSFPGRHRQRNRQRSMAAKRRDRQARRH